MRTLRKIARYIGAVLSFQFDKWADPKVQLEQVMDQAKSEHLRLTDHGATVIGNLRQIEMKLAAANKERDNLTSQIKQALTLADRAADSVEAAKWTTAAESLAGRLESVEQTILSLKELYVGAEDNARNARAAIEASSIALQERISDKARLLNKIDQAEMREQVNRAMRSLSTGVNRYIPSFDEIEQKIEGREARAMGEAELHASSVDASLLEIKQATHQASTQERLNAIRQQMGLSGPSEAIEEGGKA